MSPDDPTRRHTLIALASLASVACTGTAATKPTDTDTSADTDPPDTDAACGPPTGAQTAGPFYPGEPEARMDIRGDRTGVPLTLDLEIIAQDCTPVVDAEVDVWCADAAGDYSGYADFGTVGEDWLRGQQITDTDGMVRVTAIVPGAYPGRAVHLHVKVRAPGRPELTTQVYLPDALVADVLATAPYGDSATQVTNDADNFYAPDTLLEAQGNVTDGITASGTLVL